MYPDGTVVNYLFWMAIGALQVLIYRGIDEWAKDFNKNIKWWQTALLYGCVLSFFVVIFAGFTLKGEFEGNAGWYMIGVFGSMHIIVGAVLTRLFLMRGRGAKLKASV